MDGDIVVYQYKIDAAKKRAIHATVEYRLGNDNLVETVPFKIEAAYTSDNSHE